MHKKLSRYSESYIESKDKEYQNEEEVRFQLVTPFIENVLGYPREAIKVEEKTGTKKSMDYVLYSQDGNPIMIVETKQSLGNNKTYKKDLKQLLDYINECNRNKGKTERIEFGLLSDGIMYDFYYKEGDKDFLILRLDMEDLPDKKDEEPLALLTYLTYPQWNKERAKEIAEERGIISLLREEFKAVFFNNPPLPAGKDYSNLCKFFWEQIKSKMNRSKILSDFEERFQKAVIQELNDYLTGNTVSQNQGNEVDNPDSDIITTRDEIYAYHVVKSILAIEADVDPNRITFKDTKNWFSVQIDGSTHKTIARFWVEKGRSWKVNFANTGWDKKEDLPLEKGLAFKELYSNYKKDLIESAKKYLS